MGDNEKRAVFKSLLDSHGRLRGEPDIKTSNKLKEPLSDRELRELMGTNRDTFKRHKGAVRRR